MHSPNARFLLNSVRPHRWLIALTLLGSMLAAAFDSISIGLLVPLLASLQEGDREAGAPWALELFERLFDAFSIEPTIGPVVAAVLAAIAGKNILQVAVFCISFRVLSRITADMRKQAAEVLMNVGVEFHDQVRASDLTDVWYNKIAAVETLIRTAIIFAANLITILFLFVLLFLLSWKLTLMAVLLFAAGSLVLRWYSRRVNQGGKRLSEAERDLLAAMNESLKGIRLIRTTGAEKNVLRQLHSRIDRRSREVFRGNIMIHAMHPAADLLGSAGIAGLALLALGLLDVTPALALTLLLPFLYVLLRLVPLTKALAQQRATMAQLLPNLDQVVRLVRADDKPFVRSGDRRFSGLSREICFQDVTFIYPGREIPALSGVNLRIPAHRTTAIVGETGSGKSTIVNLLLRLYDPTSGEIRIDDVPVKEFDLASLHGRTGFVSQDTVLFNDTIWANLTFSMNRVPGREEVFRAARMADIDAFIRTLPQKYDTVVGDSGVRLSGGQKQRLAIARALLRNPDVLILDEATSALDARTERRIHRSIAQLSEGRTVIIVAHRLSTVEDADHVVVLKEGTVVESGSLLDLRTANKEYTRLAARTN